MGGSSAGGSGVPEGNPLVAQAQSQTTGVTGIAVAESAVDLASGVKDGSWVEFGMGALGVGLEVLSLALDPIGTLAQYGVSWLIEHVQPLKEALDWLAGDPPVIQSFADTWANVAKEVEAIGGDLANEAKTGTVGWTGAAGDAYRNEVTEQTDAIAGAATLADGISTGVMIMGQVVSMVRETVRDLIAELVGKLISWALEEACTLGFATPLVAAQATAAITKAMSKVGDLIRRLVKTIGNVAPKIRKIVDKLGEIMEKLSKLGKKLGRRADGTTPSAAKAGKHDAPGPHSPDAPDTPHSADTPDASTPGTGKNAGDSPGSAKDRGSNRPDNPKDSKTPQDARTTCNDPIDVVTGEMVLGQTDVELAGVLPLILRRTHVSSYRAGLSFGRSWASTVDQRLEFDEQGVLYVADDGMLLVYPEPPTGGEALPVVGPRWPLSRTESGFAIERDNGEALHFTGASAIRPLSSIVDRDGNRIDIDRDAAGVPVAVRHSGGYHLGFGSEAGRITELRLRDPGGDIVLVRYRYHESGHLAEVVNSSDRPARFDYDHAGRITQWTDRNGEWYRYFYDAAGRCVANQGSGGFLNGAFDYDDEARTTRFTSALGNITTYRFNEERQVVAETDPLGNTMTSEWDDRDRLLSRTDPLGNTTRYEYDDAGNLVRLTRPDGTQALSEYNEAGLPTIVVEPGGATWRQFYDDRGRRTALVDPTGATTRYSYDTRGCLTELTDPSGAKRRIESDAAGLPITIIDPLGATTRYTRDQFGRITTVTDPLGGTTSMRWTVEGLPLSRTHPDGGTDTWRYDGEGNETEHVDPQGKTTRTNTTHFDLPSARTAPDGTTVRYEYDAELRLVAAINEQGLAWRHEYDAAGNLVRETDFSGRQLTYSHDAAGRLVSRTNGAGQTVRFAHDPLGNVVEQHDGTTATRFTFDEAGRMIRAVNADADIRFEHDPRGRVLTESVNGRTVVSRYDPLGRRTYRRTPSGVESHLTFDANHQPLTLRTGGRTVTFGYDPSGREVERLLDTGTIVAQTWDTSRRLATQTVSAVGGSRSDVRAELIQRRAYSYRADGYVAAVEDRFAGAQRFDLDPVGRVVSVGAERYSYDAAGNIVAATVTGEPEAREYESTLVRRAGNTRYEYDTQGRVVFKQRKRLSAKPANWRYSWDALDRLSGVVTPDGTHWRYRYDPLGRRIAKEKLATDGFVTERVDFTWDGLTLAEQEHRRESVVLATTWEWSPSEVKPLVQVERRARAEAPQDWFDQQFFTIVTDLLGTPSELVTSDGRLAWRNSRSLWGATADGTGTPLGFPGQYHDAETGLEYNLYRYYDAALGRYYSSDPLGLAAGFNPYAYVPNPTVFSDPLGLTPCRLRQLKMDLGQAGMSVRDYDIVHVPEILDHHGLPAWADSPATPSGPRPHDPDIPNTGPRGRPLIRISDRGLEDTDTAIASIFHEIYHQRSRQLWGHGGTESQAEEYGQRMLAEYRRRTGQR